MRRRTSTAGRAALVGWLCISLGVSAQTPVQSLYHVTPGVPQGANASGPVRSNIWLVVQFIARFQYVPQALDAAFAEKVLLVYSRVLDPERLFFSAQDVASFQAQGSQLSQMLPADDVSVPRAIAKQHAELATRRLEKVIALLGSGEHAGASEIPDVTVSDDAPFLGPDKLDERWRQIVKSDWAQLKLAGKKDTEIRALLVARYRAFERHVQAIDDRQMVSRFLDAYAMASGEGSEYFGEQGRPFAALAQLGLVVSSDAYGPVINHVSPSLQLVRGQIQAGDRLVGVAVDGGDVTYLDGWQTSELKSLLERVAPGAAVHLSVRRHDVAPGGEVQTVLLKATAELLRDGATVRAVSALSPAVGEVAVIRLPEFYLDSAAKQRGDTNFESSSRDVQRMLMQAQQSGARGVILDLRGNGGGSLPEAADIASLFVGKRPLWRTRNAKGDVEETHGAHDEALWTGPVAVLIDHASAEGAELVASALQDNQRALVVGKRSTGAGNVASAVDLNRFPRDSQSVTNGMLKLTIATTFRANGENVTGHGVVPDLELPVAPAFSSVSGPALVTFDSLPPMTLEPMSAAKSTLLALHHEQNDHTGKVPASGGSQYSAYADDGDLLRDIAALLVEGNGVLAR